MLDRPVAFYRVNAAFVVHGLHGCAGDILGFWPGHPTHTLATREGGRGPRRVRSHQGVPDGIAYGLLLQLLNDDAITPLTFLSASVVQRPELLNALSPRGA